jgi:hypothetical protein
MARVLWANLFLLLWLFPARFVIRCTDRVDPFRV